MSNKFLALTFDDGPSISTTIQVLDVLEKYNIVGSFFVCGNHINKDTESIIKRAINLGCEINNHSYSHSNMTELSKQDILEEINNTSKLIEDITEVSPKFFRPPYIAINQLMFDTINLPFINGYGSNDWDNNVSIKERYLKIIKQICDGGIILLHDFEGNSKTVQLLDILIPYLISMGYSFVTTSKLFELKNIIPQINSNILYTNVLHGDICKW